MTETHLPGLEGTNQLGFLAALGVQTAFMQKEDVPKLWWSDDVVPHAIVDDEFSAEQIATQVMNVAAEWRESEALYPQFLPEKDREDIKFDKDNIRVYLERATSPGPGSKMPLALVAEGSLDNKDQAKPTDLHFTAGTQKFLKIAREILTEAQESQILTALNGTDVGTKKFQTLGWDVADDRLYALRAIDPSGDKKILKPGLEAMAILGLSALPVFGSPRGTLTLGCSGSWKYGTFTWAIWDQPAGPGAVSSLLAAATHSKPHDQKRMAYFKSWGLSQVFRSEIRRSDQGGYGTFGPHEVVWSREQAATVA